MQPAVPRQELTHDRPLVIPAPIPHHDDLATQVFEQIPEVAHDTLGGVEPVRFGGEVGPESLDVGLHADAADDGDLFPMAAVGVEYGRLADDRPRPPHDRVEEQPGFIDPDEVGTGVARFFRMRGQSLATQCTMFASLRWRGRRTGRCGE